VSIHIDAKLKVEAAENLVRVFEENGMLDADEIKMFTDCDKNLKEALALYREDLGLDEEEEDEEWD
jgi:hypothetical protein|tara:strand:- start:1678 stop:1875 length:198 start_codon:yes stop_codon:yes gene_type:complete